MRRLAFLIVTATMLTAGFLPAAAQGDDLGDRGDDPPTDSTPSPGTPTINDNSATVTVSFREDLRITDSRGGRPGRQAKCGFFSVSGDQFYSITLTPVTPTEEGRLYIVHCWYVDGGGSVPGFPDGYLCCDPGIPGTTVVNVYQVAEHAAASINFTLPAFETSPAAEQVVGIETWLAITSQLDYDVAHADAGPLWATITPQFSHAEWDLGNGDTVTCTTDVTKLWEPAGPDTQTTECGYVFTTNEDGEPFQGSVTATWDLFWTRADPNNPANTLGPTLFGQITQTSPVEFTVRELQAVID